MFVKEGRLDTADREALTWYDRSKHLEGKDEYIDITKLKQELKKNPRRTISHENKETNTEVWDKKLAEKTEPSDPMSDRRQNQY